MIIPRPEPQELSIKVNSYPEYVLVDRRIRTDGIVFGTIENVARQYGIKMVVDGYTLVFTAPKSRLQFFAEKLHFARVQFS